MYGLMSFCSRHRIVNRIWVFVLLVSVFGHNVLAETEAEKDKRIRGRQPYCGLYCLYSIFKLEGREIDFHSLVKPEYLGSRKGSSFEELKQAAQDVGLNAVFLSRLTPDDLKDIALPAILHVKSSPEQKDYDHFVLYLGNKDGKTLIFDPPAEQSTVEFGKLMSKWDGNALIISSKPIGTNEITTSSRKRLAVYVSLIILGIAAIHGLKRFSPVCPSIRLQLCLSAGQAAGFTVVVVLTGLLYHYFYSGGFFANPSAVEGVQVAYAGSFIPKVTPGKMQTIVAMNNTVILDARLKRDYETGHIANAINLPINCSDEEYTQITSSLSKDKQMVLYCQSAGCQFAEKMALRLKENGFDNLSVFKGGWVEWQKTNETRSAKTGGQRDEKDIS